MKQISLFWFLGYCKILFVMIYFLITYEVCSTRKFYLKILYNIFFKEKSSFSNLLVSWAGGERVGLSCCNLQNINYLFIHLFYLLYLN